MVNDPGQLGHEFRHQIHPDICLRQLERVQVFDAKGGVERKDLLDDSGKLCMLHHGLVVALHGSDGNHLPRQTLPGRIREIWFGHFNLEASSLTVPNNRQHFFDGW